MSYQILPNIIFFLAILGVILIILRRLPELSQNQTKTEELSIEKKLESKGLPAVSISKFKTHVKVWTKKIWQFMLEAKDLRHTTAAGYKIKKIFAKKSRVKLGSAAPAAATAWEVKDEKYFLEEIKREPKNLSHYNELGKFYLERNNFSDAKDIYLYLSNHEPSNDDYHAKLAYCFYQIKNYDKAAQHYETSLTLDSNHPNRYYNLGLCLDELGKFQESIKAFEQAIALEPENSKFYLALSAGYAKLGQVKKAKDTLLKAKKIDPANEAIKQKLAQFP